MVVAVRRMVGVDGADAAHGGQNRQSKRGRDGDASDEVVLDEVRMQVQMMQHEPNDLDVIAAILEVDG